MTKISPNQCMTLDSLAGSISPEGYAIAATQVIGKAASYSQPLSASSPLANGQLPTVENLPKEALEELVDALAYAHLLKTLGGVDVTGPIIAAICAVDKALLR